MDSPSALTPRLSSASPEREIAADDRMMDDDQQSQTESILSTGRTSPLPEDSDAFSDTNDRDAYSDVNADTPRGANDSDSSAGDAAQDNDSDAEEHSDPGQSSDNSYDEPPRRRIRTSKSMAEDALQSARMNPALYGLRRSTRRTRAQVSMVDSGSESEDAPSRQVKRQRTTVRATKQPAPRYASSYGHSDSDNSDSSDYAPRSSRKRQTKRQSQASEHIPRSSRRAAARQVNYNEEEEDDEDDREYYYVDENDNTPSIDLVLHHRPKAGVSLAKDDNLDKSDFEYLIKWQGQARYHATWETSDSFVPQKSRKIDNYFNKVVWIEIEMARNPDTHIEDREQWSLDLEQRLDSLEENKQVDRVIAKRTNDDGDIEYLTKWKGLPYDSATWEEEYLIQQLSDGQITRFEERTAELPTSDRLEAIPATRSKFLNWSQLGKGSNYQPSYIKGRLRPFQIFGVMWLAYNWTRDINAILADEMGLGKTVQSVTFLSWLRHERIQNGPFLVVVPLSTMSAWAETFAAWDPDMNFVVYQGNDASRQMIREHELLEDNQPNKVRFNALLTSYEYINRDTDFLSKIKWQVLIVDEAHRLKNSESDLYRNLSRYHLGYRLLLTGTPLQNNILELSSLLHFIDPYKFSKDDDFDVLGDDHEFIARKIQELSEDIKPHILRRVKTDVEKDLPRKTEFILRVPLANAQRELYTNIHERNYAALTAQVGTGHSVSLINIMMESRKAANHPFLFPSMREELTRTSETRAEYLHQMITSSGKMVLLDKLLGRLKREGHRVLIFSQMVRMIDILNEYMKLRNYQFQRLDGNVPSDQRRKAMDHFNAPDSQDFVFLLSTRAGGLGINLVTADTVILFDSDWNPQADIQAMCRAHRIGQKNPVTVYRFVSEATVEEDILAAGVNKLFIEHLTIQMGVTDKEGLADITDRFKKAGALSEAPTSGDQINDMLKRRAQKMFQSPDQQDQLEALDIDSFLEQAEEAQTVQAAGLTTDGTEEFLQSFEQNAVNINVDWDEIVPQDRLEKFREESQKKKEEEEAERRRTESQPRQRRQAVRDEIYDDASSRTSRRRAKPRKGSSSGDSDDDDDRPPSVLSETHLRRLINGFEKFGSWEDMSSKIVSYGNLSRYDPSVLKEALADLLEHCQALVDQKQLEWSRAGVTAKKDRQAILFTFRGVTRLNAETLLSRPWQLRVIRKAIAEAKDPISFRVTEVDKFPNYTCEWGAREDAMLLVGIARHGFGSWSAIANDPELNMSDRMFLEEHREKYKKDRANGVSTVKSPGPLHLIRRVQHLSNVLSVRYPDDSTERPRKSEKSSRTSKRESRSNGSGHVKGEHTKREQSKRERQSSERLSPNADNPKASRIKQAPDSSRKGRKERNTDPQDDRKASKASESKPAREPKVTKFQSALMSLPSFKKKKTEFSSIGVAPSTLPPRPVDRSSSDRPAHKDRSSVYRDERRDRDSRYSSMDRRRRSRSRTPPRDDRGSRSRRDETSLKDLPRRSSNSHEWNDRNFRRDRPDSSRIRESERDRPRERYSDSPTANSRAPYRSSGPYRERDYDRERDSRERDRDRDRDRSAADRNADSPRRFIDNNRTLPKPLPPPHGRTTTVSSTPRPWAR